MIDFWERLGFKLLEHDKFQNTNHDWNSGSRFAISVTDLVSLFLPLLLKWMLNMLTQAPLWMLLIKFYLEENRIYGTSATLCWLNEQADTHKCIWLCYIKIISKILKNSWIIPFLNFTKWLPFLLCKHIFFSFWALAGIWTLGHRGDMPTVLTIIITVLKQFILHKEINQELFYLFTDLQCFMN